MTPEDVAAMAEEVHEHGSLNKVDALALCDALEAAWVENGDLNEEIFNMGTTAHWRMRAEHAEAELDEHEKTILRIVTEREELRERAERAEAELRQFKAFEFADMQATKVRFSESLGRVEALCDEWQGDDDVPAWTWRLLRAAIEGDNQ